jgi:hypothetical protein
MEVVRQGLSRPKLWPGAPLRWNWLYEIFFAKPYSSNGQKVLAELLTGNPMIPRSKLRSPRIFVRYSILFADPFPGVSPGVFPIMILAMFSGPQGSAYPTLPVQAWRRAEAAVD